MNKDRKEALYLHWESYIDNQIKAFLVEYSVDPQQFDDLKQEVAIHIYTSLDSFDPTKSQVKSFVHRKTNEFLKNYFKTDFRGTRNQMAKNYREETQHLGSLVYNDSNDHSGFEEILEESELSERELRFIRLKYIGGYTDKEIAYSEGLERSTVSKVLSKAIKQLREDSQV